LKLYNLKIFVLIFSLSFSLFTKADTSESLCLDDKNKYFNNFSENIMPKKISIEIKKNKKWQKDNLKILTSLGTIKKEYKKRYSANVNVLFQNNISCIFKAKIRRHGDFKDHIELRNGNIIQSLDVHLKNGHINGITKFKLLLPETRGAPDDEIILTEILRSLNIMAPRTFYVTLNNQSTNSKMLFQEKAVKEFLEFNNRKESVILEGDERYLYDDDLNHFTNSAYHFSLSKISNKKLLNKNQEYKNIMINATAFLNEFYLEGLNYYMKEYDYDYDYSKIKNMLLDKSNAKILKNKFDIFNNIIFASNSFHALIPHNRKFYWNAEYQSFEPIYYDGNPNILALLDIKKIPKNKNFFDSLSTTLDLFKNLDFSKIKNNIAKNFNTKKYDEQEIKFKFSKILNNLTHMKSYEKNLNFKKDNYPNYNENLKKYFKRIKGLPHQIVPIFSNSTKNRFYECAQIICKKVSFNNQNLITLLNGKYKKNEKYYQFIGVHNIENKKLKGIFVKKNDLINLSYQNSNLSYNKNDYTLNKISSNTLEFIQKIPNTKITIKDGSIKNTKIILKLIPLEKNLNNKTINQKGLTGCLNLIDLDIKDIIIEIENANCEDAINIIRSQGHIKKIKSSESTNDALDMDFSNISIDDLIITNSGNDCVDLSFGSYQFNNVEINFCGDKGISVGERSKLFSNLSFIKNTDIGIAVKDSSIAKLKNANFDNVKTCFAAYKKKQEFNGGKIKVKKIECLNYDKKTDIDIFSEITHN
jgi:hypothetical protein